MCWQCAPLLVFSVDNIDLSILSGIVFATLIIGEPSAHARTLREAAARSWQAATERENS
jgi:hypothetical protein